jgi:hypothetical protein
MAPFAISCGAPFFVMGTGVAWFGMSQMSVSPEASPSLSKSGSWIRFGLSSIGLAALVRLRRAAVSPLAF